MSIDFKDIPFEKSVVTWKELKLSRKTGSGSNLAFPLNPQVWDLLVSLFPISRIRIIISITQS